MGNSIAFSQCEFEVPNWYSVNVSLTPTEVLAPQFCPFGYSFTVVLEYDISITGNNPPLFLWALQGRLNCSGTELFFDLPNFSSQGNTFTISAYTFASNCDGITPAELGCNSATILVRGPGGLSVPYEDCPLDLGQLPVEFSSLDLNLSENNEVEICWETASEVNNDYFTIERSYDSRQWESIAEVEGFGNSNRLIEYCEEDEPNYGLVYYRILQTDLDGSYSYSETKSIIVPSRKNELEVFPNPATDHIYVRANDIRKGIKILDINGKNVIDISQIPRDTDLLLSLDISSLEAGIYIIQVGGSSQLFSKI